MILSASLGLILETSIESTTCLIVNDGEDRSRRQVGAILLRDKSDRHMRLSMTCVIISLEESIIKCTEKFRPGSDEREFTRRLRDVYATFTRRNRYVNAA